MFQLEPNHTFPQKLNLNRQQQQNCNYNNVHTFVVVVTPYLSDFHQSDSQLCESTKATPSCVSPPKWLPVVSVHKSESQLCQSTNATPSVRIHQGDSQLCKSTKATSSCTSPSSTSHHWLNIPVKWVSFCDVHCCYFDLYISYTMSVCAHA